MASLDWLAMKYCCLSIYIVAFKNITYKILAYCHFYTTKNKPDLEHVHLMYPSVDVKSSLEKSLWFLLTTAGIDQYIETLERAVLFQKKPPHIYNHAS